MRRNYYILFLFLFVYIASIWGNPITVNQAQQIASNFFSSSSSTRSTSSLKLLYVPAQTRSGGDAEYFIFALEAGKGFVVVSGDDALPSIVGYSLEAPALAQRIPKDLVAWLGEYARYVNDIRAGKAKATAIVTREGAVVTPLVKTKWNQSMPFNDLCPIGYYGKKPSGCVATSMAQIMKHHNWPEQGVGILENSGNTVDLSTYKYDWDNMVNEYPTKWNQETNLEEPDGYTEMQALAVATLMRDCGYSVDMSYGDSESGAVTSLLVRALRNNFKYAPTVKYYSRTSYTTETWTQMLREELQAGRPVNYSGSSPSGAGHSFVCDGIDAKNYLHINWGWGGYCDGYFDMGVLAPDDTGIGGGDGAYFCNQGIVAGIRPVTPEDAALVPDDRLLIAGLELSLSESEKRLYVSMLRLENNSAIAHQVSPVVVWLKEDGTVDQMGRIDFNASFPTLGPGRYFNKIGGFSYVPYTTGIHRFIIANRMGDDTYEKYDMGEFMDGGTVVITDEGMTLQTNHSELTSDISLLYVTQPTTGYTEQDAAFNVKFKNAGKAPYEGDLYLALVPEALDDGTITDYKDYTDIESWYPNKIPLSIYGNSEQEWAMTTWGLTTPGRYRVHYCERKYIDDTYKYIAIPEAAPQYIELKQLPDYPMLTLTGQLEMWEKEYKQEVEVWIGAFVFPKTNKDFSGKLELWALKEGDNLAKEVCLLSKQLSFRAPGPQYLEDFCDFYDKLIIMEEGVYTAYLKYEANGEMIRIEGEYNKTTFTLKAADTPQLYMNAPVEINAGQPVPLGSMVEVKVSVTSRMAFTGSVRLSSGTTVGENWVNVLSCNENPKVSLAAGETKIVTMNCGVTSDQSLLNTHSLESFYYDEAGAYLGNISLGNYEKSADFALVDAAAVQIPRLAAALVVSSGSEIEQGTEGNVKATVVSDVDLSGKLYIYCRTNGNVDVLQGTMVAVNLKAGVQQEITLPYSCPQDAPLGDHILSVYYKDGESAASYQLANGNSENRVWFTVVVFTGIEKEVADNCRLISQPGAFLLKDIAENARVQVSALNGSILFKGTASATEMRIPMDGAAPGFYMVTVEAHDGKIITLKGILK